MAIHFWLMATIAAAGQPQHAMTGSDTVADVHSAGATVLGDVVV
jgi:hypothetical protein